MASSAGARPLERCYQNPLALEGRRIFASLQDAEIYSATFQWLRLGLPPATLCRHLELVELWTRRGHPPDGASGCFLPELSHGSLFHHFEGRLLTRPKPKLFASLRD